MAEQTVPVLISMGNPRATPDGSAIVCTFNFSGGVSTDFAIQLARLPIFLNDLRTFGSLAEVIQRGLPSAVRRDELVVPYRAKHAATARALTGEVVLKIVTDEGSPVVFAFPPPLATRIGDQLKAEVSNPPKAAPSN